MLWFIGMSDFVYAVKPVFVEWFTYTKKQPRQERHITAGTAQTRQLPYR